MHENPLDDQRRAQERLRYRVLEYVYLRVGDDCERPVNVGDIERDLGVPRLQMIEAIGHLTYACGYLRHAFRGGSCCLTAAGLRYLRAEAGLRQSVRG